MLLEQTKTLPTWRQMNMDTSPEIERIHFALLKSKPLWEKMKLLTGMERSARRLVLVAQTPPNSKQRRVAIFSHRTVVWQSSKFHEWNKRNKRNNRR